MPTADPIRILLCPLTTHERDGWVHPNLMRFVADLPHMKGYASAVIPLNNFTPAAAARNIICKSILEKDDHPDWLCMIDNDMDPPCDLFDTIKDCPSDAGIVVPEFSMFNQTEKKLTLCWCPNIENYDGSPLTLDRGFHELTKCGTGVMFIRPSILKEIPYPYFTYVYDADGRQIGTEDIAFCEKARKVGVKIYGNNQVKVGHYKSVDLSVISQMLYEKKVLDAVEMKGVDSVPA